MTNRWLRVVAPLFASLALLRGASASRIAGTPPASPVPDVMYVAGSSQKVCQVTGETDLQFNTPTASQTGTRFGLFGADLGYSFDHDGKLFFLFGDAMPTPKFHGQPNGSPPRDPDDNDATGYTADTIVDQCPTLDFIADASGSFKSPVVLDAQGQPAITLRIDEMPISGISANGRMYVVFGTDNYVYPTPGPKPGALGAPTRSVVGVSDDDAKTFHYLYDLSSGSGAKFIYTTIAQGDSGYLYFWGTQGGTRYRQSAPYFARKQGGSMDQAGGMEYFAGLASDGTPAFSTSEADAVPLFQDFDGAGLQPKDCMANLSADWNPFVNRWIMLYGCTDRTSSNPGGIYMRTAQYPWGPWTAAQTIFSGERDQGTCHFIHRAVTATDPACDYLSTAERMDESGGSYAPYLIPGWATGAAGCGTSTLYYTMATFNPYTQVLMTSAIQGSGQAAGDADSQPCIGTGGS